MLISPENSAPLASFSGYLSPYCPSILRSEKLTCPAFCAWPMNSTTRNSRVSCHHNSSTHEKAGAHKERPTFLPFKVFCARCTLVLCVLLTLFGGSQDSQAPPESTAMPEKPGLRRGRVFGMQEKYPARLSSNTGRGVQKFVYIDMRILLVLTEHARKIRPIKPPR